MSDANRPTIPADTIERQARAVDPGASAFVSANAGSGKTFVLTRRVVRLLLAGTDPGRILCLTFTKAAAAEMATRVFEVLGGWTRLSDADLASELRAIEGAAPDARRLAEARRLFARALETPGGLKIQTIHAFCEALLHAFPLEANVAGHFAVVDDRGKAEMLAAAQAAVIETAAADTEGPLGAALRTISAIASDVSFLSAIDTMVASRDDLGRWIREAGDLEAAIRGLAASFGLSGEETEEALAAEIAASHAFDVDYLNALIPALEEGKSTDLELAERFRTALAATNAGARADLWRTVFFTADGKKPRSGARWATKAVKGSFPDLMDRFDREVGRLEELLEKLKAFSTVTATAALLRLADEVIALYTAAKSADGLLDFDDLVARTADLLTQSDASAWVHFKLDLGLDHVLVDEAQDTSPRQWQVITTLVEEFFAGETARPQTRTLFAVGDEKQSIYSFQGAAPHLFAAMDRRFALRAREANLAFHDERLTLSFRSTPDVLAAVDRVFASEDARRGLSLDEGPTVHEAWRRSDPGVVEIWPLVTEPKEEAAADWREPLDHEGPNAPARKLADRIADTVATWIATGERLEGTGRPIRPEDILVLVRKRGPFVDALDRALKARGLPTAGSDRLVLTEHIAVMDLMALARVALLPEDDLSLASVLKSPLVGLSEEALFALAHGRTGSLHAALVARKVDPAFAIANDVVAEALARADFLRPYEFFARLLGPDGGRRRFRARLGAEVDDILDEFLGLALTFEQGATPSLEGFLHWLGSVPTEVKRALDTDARAIRTMTVHGAKGLEAPIVFLVDGCAKPVSTSHDPTILKRPVSEIPDAAPALVWKQKAERATAWQADALQAARKDAEAEYHRLLYVALTRARDRLIVAAYKAPYAVKEDGTLARAGADTAPEGTWYDLVSRALLADATPLRTPGSAPDAYPAAWRWQVSSGPAREPAEVATLAGEPPALPAWLDTPAPPPETPLRVSPSAAVSLFGEDQEPERFPKVDALEAALAGRTSAALERGRLAHRLLELLPGVEANRRAAAAQRLLHAAPSTLPPHETAALLAEVLAVLDHPDFGAVFRPEGRAEIAVAGTLPDRSGRPVAVSGQIDRLIVTDTNVLIVDYKTNRPVPHTPEAIPDAYVAQLALYRALIAPLYPDRPVRAALLWTFGPALDEIPADRLDAHASRLNL